MQIERIYKRRLPHAFAQCHPVFLTWRLKFTLPKSLMDSIKARRDAFCKQIEHLSKEYQKMQMHQYQKKEFIWFDEAISTQPELPALLKNNEIAMIVGQALQYHAGTEYNLHTYCIMPNHVHALLTPLCTNAEIDEKLKRITFSIKRYTAGIINKKLGRKGEVWARESYDHIIRNEAEFQRTLQYIIYNPVKAGLVQDWHEFPNTWVEVKLRETL